MRNPAALGGLLSLLLLAGCKPAAAPSAPSASSEPTPAAPAAASRPNPDGAIPSGTGVEKGKPPAGRGAVQGKVFYNGKPVPSIEVRLCEKFNRFLGGCGGEALTVKTDANGEYWFKSVPPGVYEGLLVRVFDTDSYVFATSGIASAAKYRIEADRTFFAPDTNLFKSDLKIVSPRASAKIAPSDIEVKWADYPDAAYYKMSVFADSSSGAKTEYDFVNRRVDGTSFVLDRPLTPGTYTCKVEAFNGGDVKLAESARDIKFSVK